MAVLRFEPFRDPFDRLMSLAATGTRAPEKDQVIAAERPQGSFTRQLALGEGADSEHLSAEYADGVLHVTIPAAPKAQARRVQVTHGGHESGAGRPITNP